MAQVVARTKMSAALIGAVRNAAKQGVNCGRLGRIVLTNEAKGVGVLYVERGRKESAVSAGTK